jgi:4-hydroxy-tetrahydrodipicolinate synthase
MQLRGCGTALVTPFHQDGSIDEPALRALVNWQIESGIDFLVPCGTTGETPTLTHDEWLHVIDTTIEVAAGRVPIVAGATSNATHDAVAKAKELAARPGVDAILTASPYYNKPTQEGQFRHFAAIAEAVDSKPIILYNVPGRTGANLEPATLARLTEIPNIVGVKEASGNMTQIAEAINSVPETFLVFSGDDAVTLPVIALGGVGIISVASNEIPHEMAAIARAALANEWTTAHAPRHTLEAAEGRRRSRINREGRKPGARGSRFLRLRKLGRRPAQNRGPSRLLRPMRPRQRTPLRPRHQSLPLAWPLCHTSRRPRNRPRHDEHPHPQRMQVHIDKFLIVD